MDTSKEKTGPVKLFECERPLTFIETEYVIPEQQIIKLVQRVQAGDKRSMNDLVRSYYGRIYHYIWRVSGNRTTAQDVAQNTFILVFAKINQLKDHSKLTSWIYRIAHREVLYDLRKNKNKITVQLLQSGELADGNRNQQLILERDERLALVRRTLGHLPPEQVEVIVLKLYEDLTFREISEILSIPENTVKSRMYYGLKAMKKLLKNHPIIKDLYYEAS